MSSSPASPTEKEFSSPCTRYSNASSSSTFRSSTTLNSLRHVANSFGLLLPRKKPADVEQQAKPESPLGEDEDGEDEDGEDKKGEEDGEYKYGDEEYVVSSVFIKVVIY